jgi:hypothetical protein
VVLRLVKGIFGGSTRGRSINWYTFSCWLMAGPYKLIFLSDGLV